MDGAFQKVRLTRYASATAAQVDTGISHSNISKVLRDIIKSAGGYIWWFTKEDDIFDKDIIVPRVGNIPKVKVRLEIISVLPLGNGKALEQWYTSMRESVCILSEATGKKFNSGSVFKCCNGVCSRHKGYHFRRVTTEKKEDFTDGKREVEYEPERYKITKKRKKD